MGATKSDFDQVFEEISAPDYPATCNECGFEATNAEMEGHICDPAGTRRYLKSELAHELKVNQQLVKGRLSMNLNLYLISQSVNDNYDTYDAAVVCAPDEETARGIHPRGYKTDGGTWAATNDVKVELIGTAHESVRQGVVLASFNAG